MIVDMKRPGSCLIAAALLGAMLTACVQTSPPTPSATPTPSSTPSDTPTPTPTPSSTPSPTPTPTPPPSSNPPPARVVGLTATTGGGSGEVELTWTPNPESDIDHYIVMRSDTPGGPRTRIGTMTPAEVKLFPIRPFVDSSATVGYYRVRAVDTADQQGHSSEEVCGASIGHSC